MARGRNANAPANRHTLKPCNAGFAGEARKRVGEIFCNVIDRASALSNFL